MSAAFVFAHACRLNTKFDLHNVSSYETILYFKSQDGMCAVSDATRLDLNPDNFPHEATQVRAGPSTSPNNYLLSFYDPMQEYGINSFGVFTPSALRLFDNPSETIKLSDLVKRCYKDHGITKFYLNICRTPCEQEGGKSSRRKLKKTLRRRKRRIILKKSNRKTI